MGKWILIIALILFGTIGAIGLVKSKKKEKSVAAVAQAPLEVPKSVAAPIAKAPVTPPAPPKEKAAAPTAPPTAVKRPDHDLPDANRIEELFSTVGNKLPFVKTVAYSSHADWQPGRAAWVQDYARHYKTSRHFIARSLNGKADYWSQNIKNGDRFNVLDPDKKLQFFLVVDISRKLMWFYALDEETQERWLLKRYAVGLGRLDEKQASGCLTPLGKYTLGDRIAIFKPGVSGMHQNQKVEMVRVFGTRWIPFDKEIGSCTAPAKGYGIHGAPWVPTAEEGKLAEDIASIGKNESDGCIRLATADMEELFAILITRPTEIQITKDFWEVALPGKEAK